jgi:tRNA A-37 threonylcarbamoyl transferase component Bud32
MRYSLPSDYARRDCGRWTWMVRRPGGAPTLDLILEDPDAILATRADIIKTSGCATIGCFAGYVLKRWASRGMTGLLKSCARRPKAERATLNALELIDAGIPTAVPVAWGVRRRWGIEASSMLIMEHLTGAVHLGRWNGDRLPVIRRIGRLIGSLHRAGFMHRDLKPTNLLVTPDGSPYLIDLDGLRRLGAVPPTSAVADIVKLARRMMELSTLSVKEAARFTKEYASARGSLSRRVWWTNLKAAAFRYQEFHAVAHANCEHERRHKCGVSNREGEGWRFGGKRPI